LTYCLDLCLRGFFPERFELTPEIAGRYGLCAEYG
jgi:hypothetical protein